MNEIVAQDYTAKDLSDRDFTGHKFIACTFNYAKSTETTRWYGTTFHGCFFQYFNAEKSSFDRCTFHYSDAQYANFKGVKFEQCQAVWTNFVGSSFKGADAHSLVTNNCDFFMSRIQNARINPYSRDMISEIIRIDAGDDFRKLEMAAFIRNSPDICWRDFAVLANTDNYREMAKEIFRCLAKQGVVGGDFRELERYKTHDLID